MDLSVHRLGPASPTSSRIEEIMCNWKNERLRKSVTLDVLFEVDERNVDRPLGP